MVKEKSDHKIILSSDYSGTGYKKCPVCEKVFYIESGTKWTWKKGKKFFCGYNHYRQGKKVAK